MHRAGEQAMLRFLYSLYTRKVPIRPNRIIAAVPVLVQTVLKRDELGLPANQRNSGF